jgi:hypothetical protein
MESNNLLPLSQNIVEKLYDIVFNSKSAEERNAHEA